MIVTSSRQAAITYKEELDKLSSLPIGSHHLRRSQRRTKIRPYTDALTQKDQIKDFKPLGDQDGQSELSFLIVKDMLLTGFDAPVAQVMYLDRKLSDHTLPKPSPE